MDKNVAGQNQVDILSGLQSGRDSVIKDVKNNETVFEKKYELITWLIIC